MAFLVCLSAVWILVKTEQNKNETSPHMLPATPWRHWHTAEVVVCPSAVCILTGTGWNGNETPPHASPATPCRRCWHTAGVASGTGNIAVTTIW
jgi:hypothetical protein